MWIGGIEVLYHIFKIMNTDELYLIDHDAPPINLDLIGKHIEIWMISPDGSATYGRGNAVKEELKLSGQHEIDVTVGRMVGGKIENVEETLNECTRVSVSVHYEKEG